MRLDHLPRSLKTALRAGYTLAAADLDEMPRNDDKDERQRDIHDCVDNSTKETRKLFPWKWID
mgnify:FL=1